MSRDLASGFGLSQDCVRLWSTSLEPERLGSKSFDPERFLSWESALALRRWLSALETCLGGEWLSLKLASERGVSAVSEKEVYAWSATAARSDLGLDDG